MHEMNSKSRDVKKKSGPHGGVAFVATSEGEGCPRGSGSRIP